MKLLDAIFCDDIRHEINNKVSLIGLYTDKIIFRINSATEITWPLSVKLSTFLRFKIEEIDEHPNKFEFEYFINDKSIIKLNGHIKIESNQSHINLTLMGDGIPLEPGNLGFSVNLFKDDKLLFSEESKHAIKVLKE